MNSQFIISAAGKEGWPEGNRPELVVVGRSNVGKSSFINAFCNRKKLAYVGSTPGKTQLLNFFDINGKWILTDVPGYGYARLSKSQLQKMGRMMDEYFQDRENLKAVVQLVDARHGPSADDLDMIDYFDQIGLPMIVVATKIDKVPKSKRVRALKDIAQKLQIPLSDVLPVSSTERTGLNEVENRIQKALFPEAEEAEETVSE